MRFRHPNGITVSNTLGHAARIGPEWRELPQVLHQDALAAGCECDQTRFKAEKAKAESSDEAKARPGDHDDVIRTALAQMIEREGKGDFTKDGLPNTNTASKLAGMSLAKNDVLRVFRAMTAEAAE